MTDQEKSKEDQRINQNADEYFDSKFPESPLYIGPGDFECTTDPNIMLVGKVGSGVVICIFDPEIGVGGMTHFILPVAALKSFPKVNGDPGIRHVEDLIERFIRALKAHGAGKNRIRIRLYGGTSILEEFADSGLMNYVFAKDYLLRKGLMVAYVDVGGTECRRIEFHPASGKARRIKLRRTGDTEALRESEKAYLEKLRLLS
ncbi:MAG: chemotaxis protein CheD [Alphaproteobacteria bacterium]|nr:chemotaxis protein CheD [Alphaproteobacteria bacterium]